MRNKYLFALLVGLFFMPTLDAQHFNSAAGLRFGAPLSLSYKTFLNESAAVEGFVGTRGFAGFRWYNVGASYQIHKPLKLGDSDGLEYYYGGGASAYFYTYDAFFEGGSTTSFGVQGNLGIQYTFSNAPISVTMDWMPTVFLNGFGSGFGGGYGGIGVRYILSKEEVDRDVPERDYSRSAIQQSTDLSKSTNPNVSMSTSKKAAPITKQSNTTRYQDSRSTTSVNEKSKSSQRPTDNQTEEVAIDKKLKKSKKKKKNKKKKKKSKTPSRYTM